MVAEVAGQVLMVPLAPSDHDDPTKCRPIGCYVAAKHLTDRYRREEHDFYADPANHTPQGPPRRRTSKLTELVAVRFAPETLAGVRDAADADDRSVSSSIRGAVVHELDQGTARVC